VLGRSVFVRELLPQDLKVELDHISADDGRSVAYYLGMVVGRAHGRQLDTASRRAWREEMASHRTKSLDAPSWLWNALVELVSVHERAYLEHCQRFARGLQQVARVKAPARPPRRGKLTASVASAAGAADA
jgi:uncharacterized protein (DUF2252 family)